MAALLLVNCKRHAVKWRFNMVKPLITPYCHCTEDRSIDLGLKGCGGGSCLRQFRRMVRQGLVFEYILQS